MNIFAPVTTILKSPTEGPAGHHREAFNSVEVTTFFVQSYRISSNGFLSDFAFSEIVLLLNAITISSSIGHILTSVVPGKRCIV